MKDSFYFPHDYNAINDPKMMVVLSSCGLSGIAMFWIIIEILHQQTEGKIKEEAFKNYIKFYSSFENQNEQVLNKIEQVLITSGLLLSENGFIFSNRVMENKKYRKEISEKRSKAGKKSAQKRAISTSVEQNATSVEQGKERKGKKIENNNTVGIPELLNQENFIKSWNDWLEYKKQKKKTLSDIEKSKLLLKLDKLGIQRSIEAIEYSISNGYVGLFEENKKKEDISPFDRFPTYNSSI